MNKTEHYNLNQWDPEDKVTRTDFNADNAKLDALLAAKADASALAQKADVSAFTSAVSSINTAISQKADTTALNTAVAACCHIAVGSYTGATGTTQTINLGFRPKAVLIWCPTQSQESSSSAGTTRSGGLTIDGATETTSVANIVDNGFQAIEQGYVYTNISNVKYYYIAFQ